MISKSGPMEPVIKWSGSKRLIAPLLAKLLPDANCYFEPFVGGGAMLPFRKSRVALAGDVIIELIELWNFISNSPDMVANEYEKRWTQLQLEGYSAYYAVRDSFNATRNPHDLFFLTRTCVNGLIRFNSVGEFNNSLHHTRPGIAPARLRRIIHTWSHAIKGVEFIAGDYRQALTTVRSGDVVFLDPPYAGTRGRYMPAEFNLDEFCGELDRLNNVGAKWMLTFDGKAGERTYSTQIHHALYKTVVDVSTGNSPFTKLMRTGIDRVTESVYLNFELPTNAFSQFKRRSHQTHSLAASSDMDQSRLFG